MISRFAIGLFVLLFLKRRFKRKGCKEFKNGKQGKGFPRGVFQSYKHIGKNWIIATFALVEYGSIFNLSNDDNKLLEKNCNMREINFFEHFARAVVNQNGQKWTIWKLKFN